MNASVGVHVIDCKMLNCYRKQRVVSSVNPMMVTTCLKQGNKSQLHCNLNVSPHLVRTPYASIDLRAWLYYSFLTPYASIDLRAWLYYSFLFFRVVVQVSALRCMGRAYRTCASKMHRGCRILCRYSLGVWNGKQSAALHHRNGVRHFLPLKVFFILLYSGFYHSNLKVF